MSFIERPNPVRRSVVRRSRYDTGPQFAVGLDLGQARDYTAVVIVERVVHREPDHTNSQSFKYHVRHIERFELRTPYPYIVESIAKLPADPLPAGLSRLVVDGTGVGAPVVDMFLHKGLHPVPVYITEADRTSYIGRIATVPKRDLVSILQVLFQTQRLRISPELELGAALTNELTNFTARITRSLNETFSSWRENQHDDLVLALSLACWFFERQTRGNRAVNITTRSG